ncbi:MAG: hypothetical protein R3266_15300, partial [Gemmatimonadota bacterium]|nr:hypothetical protein [Gemmatimonadota bacterium]
MGDGWGGRRLGARPGGWWWALTVASLMLGCSGDEERAPTSIEPEPTIAEPTIAEPSEPLEAE